MSKTIALTQGQVALVDDDDYGHLNKHKWYAQWSSNTRSFRAVRNSKIKEGKRYQISMAREVMRAQPGQQVDHKNHDTLDNRKVNLRLCTHSENQQNRKLQAGGSSRYKGVCWSERDQKWGAYDVAAKKYHGKFAKLNFPNKEKNHARTATGRVQDGTEHFAEAPRTRS